MRAHVLVIAVCIAGCERPAKTDTRGALPTPEEISTPAPSGGATVRGRVVLDGPRPTPRLRPVTVAKEACGEEPKPDRSLLVDSHGGVAFSVVTLVQATGGSAAPSPRRSIVDHARCEFYPYVTVVPPGSTIRVESSDDILHGLRLWGSSDARTLPPGGELSYVFETEEKKRVVCDLHYWSSAWIVTTSAPHHDVTDPSGAFSIAGVEPGRWRLSAWHERFGEVEREIVVGERQTDETLVFPSLAPTPTP